MRRCALLLAIALVSLTPARSATAAEAPAATGAAIKFERDIVPILASAGCSTGPCHGKQRGQNGFQLSLLGFDPDYDYAAIAQEARGRRVFPAVPEQSLLLLKASGKLPHGGGVRLEAGSEHYELVKNWIAQGMPRRLPSDPTLEKIIVEPTEMSLASGARQPLRVTAIYSDGSSRDVTGMTAFQSNEAAIAAVDKAGVITTGPVPGEAAIMARYLDRIAVAQVAIPLPGEVPPELYTQLPRYNFVDELVWQKLQRLGITPSQPAGDATFLRRAYLDIIGRVPTPDEVRAFLADTSGEKRVRLVDELLERPEYADFWANKWADLLRPNPYRVGLKTVFSFDGWIRDAFRQNLPYDQFVRELVAAQGSTWRNGAAVLFRDRREPEELTTIVSQLFLGVRLECAKCHHHPFEVWGQDDFYSFAAYFSRIGRKGQGISPPISGSEEMVFTGNSRPVKHPLTGAEMKPRPLFGAAPEIGEDDDPRESLAAWITSPENPYFVQVIANRVWADLMGRGLVEPVDDLRATNPPQQRAAFGGAGGRFPPARVRSEEAHPHHLHVVCVWPQFRAERAEPGRYAELLAALSPAAAGGSAAGRHLRYYARAGIVLRAPAAVAVDRVVDAPGQFAVPGCVWPARSQPGPALRADGRHDGGASTAPDECTQFAQEDHGRWRLGRRIE